MIDICQPHYFKHLKWVFVNSQIKLCVKYESSKEQLQEGGRVYL